MKITKDELKNTLQIATGEVLNELKSEVAEIVEEAIVPAIKNAVDKFQQDLKEEAKSSGSVWVKIRNYSLVGIIEIAEKVILSIFSKIK